MLQIASTEIYYRTSILFYTLHILDRERELLSTLSTVKLSTHAPNASLTDACFKAYFRPPNSLN